MLNSLEKTETSENKELPDVSGYKEIKSNSDMPMKEVYDYWNDVFSEQSDSIGKELSDEEMWERMFGKEESEFTFDFDTQDAKLQEVIYKFNEQDWDRLSESEKVEAMEQFVSNICEALGVENKPSLRFFEDDENVCGAFNHQINTIDINKNTLHNPKEIIDTLAHEARHAYQHQRAVIGETDTDKLYDFNFKHYFEPTVIDGYYINLDIYEAQFVEAEARAFANLFRS